MRRRLLLTGGALTWAIGARAQGSDAGLLLPAGALEALRRAHNVPGVSVAVATESGVAWGGAGVAHGDAPVRADTLFQAASISKTLTAVAVLRLAEQGRLDLDSDVNAYLRSWHLPDSPLAGGEKVTLRRIAGHIAGINVPGFPGYAADAALPTLADVLDGRPPANTPAIRIAARPGQRYSYSGGNAGFKSFLFADPRGQRAAAIMANGENGERLWLALAAAICDAYGWPRTRAS